MQNNMYNLTNNNLPENTLFTKFFFFFLNSDFLMQFSRRMWSLSRLLLFKNLLLFQYVVLKQWFFEFCSEILRNLA